MTTEDIKWGIQMLQWLIIGCIALYAHLMGRNAANAAEVALLRQKLTALEENVRHLPDARQFHEVAGAMKEMKATLDGVRDGISPLARAVDRINDYLLTHK